MFTFTSLIVGGLFLTMNHPLAMGLILLIQTLMIALLTGTLASSFWFSYILFLVFLGGMLVLFIYVTSLASNEMFSISAKTFLLTGMMFSSGLIVFLLNDPLSWSLPHHTSDTLSIFPPTDFSIAPLLIKLYSSPTHLLTLLLVIYLFLTLVAVVTITNISEGPLRAKN
uniref:NADH-ubiquinone oxidoreductase chain 6 n=1 Tax=Maccaffertium mediopunctatum TaxID=603968 RepID=A0A8F6U6G1_9INSE|nr:NADH dehydrogenase subunit 6 [Maccaffertium mediopunctatum]